METVSCSHACCAAVQNDQHGDALHFYYRKIWSIFFEALCAKSHDAISKFNGSCLVLYFTYFCANVTR